MVTQRSAAIKQTTNKHQTKLRVTWQMKRPAEALWRLKAGLTQATPQANEEPMAKAVRSLSPKQILERMRRHRHAVAVLALMRAKKAVQAQIRAKGQRISDYSAREISHLAHAEFERNRTRLIADAEHTVNTANINDFGRSDIRCEMIVGYARVSTDGQSLEHQQAALVDAGCAKVFAEKVSGAKTDRATLAKALAALTPGDTLVVCKLDRLARSTRDLLNTLAAVADAGASFRSLGDPWADTTTPHGRLMLTVLGGLAEFERHLILARTSEGRHRAQARGVRFGRKRKLTLHQQQEALARRAAGEALVDIARSYAVSHSTISRLEATI